MKGRLPFNLLILALIVQHYSGAQNSFSFSDYFDQFFNNYYLLNPANQDSTYRLNLAAADKAQTGLFRGVNQIYLDADLRINPEKEVFHFIGIQAINNREGEFINKNRLVGRYSWRARISQQSSLSAGIALGFVNYAFNTSQSGTGGADLQPDGSAGVWYLRKRISMGFSIQQLFNQPIRPVNQTFILARFYNLNFNYFIPISPYVNFRSHFYSKIHKDQPFSLSLAGLLEFQDKLEAGINYRIRRGISYIAGIKKIKISNSFFSFYFSYNSGNRIVNVSDNALEFFIRYQK